MLLFSRQGKLRLQKWYTASSQKEKKKITRDLITTVLARKPKMCSFLEYKDLKIVYKRYIMAKVVLIYDKNECLSSCTFEYFIHDGKQLCPKLAGVSSVHYYNFASQFMYGS